MPENLATTLCAFANMPQPGIILLGIDERQDFAVAGASGPASLEKAVANLNRNSVVPAPQLEFTHLQIEGKSVLVVEVTPLAPQEKPARVNNQPYLRQADGDYKMNSNDLRVLELSALIESQQPQFDFAVLTGTNTEILDQEILARYLETVRERPRLSRVEDDRRLLQ
ncbi:AlbA family DNA-binding domain-containing protein [Corynebacterium aquatimens]|uniref:AlbA family DNA-binding domain-containing protein n=1 Tax=Corynebacterium aquatimens TaxID=1190508 RepID=UPI0025400B32|nr:RNA-binding domain-containing protein [Corynebacterium aquatimens]